MKLKNFGGKDIVEKNNAQKDAAYLTLANNRTKQSGFEMLNENFDERKAKDLAAIMRKIFALLENNNKLEEITLDELNRNVIPSVTLLWNTYNNLTLNYLDIVKQIDYLEKHPPNFEIDKCDDGYLEDDYAATITLMKEKIIKSREEQLEKLIRREAEFKQEYFDPKQLEIKVVILKLPTTGSEMGLFLIEFQFVYPYLIITENFEEISILSDISRYRNLDTLSWIDIMSCTKATGAELYYNTKKNYILMKNFADAFFGLSGRKAEYGLYRLGRALAELDSGVEVHIPQDESLDRLTEDVGGRILLLYIYAKDFYEVEKRMGTYLTHDYVKKLKKK